MPPMREETKATVPRMTPLIGTRHMSNGRFLSFSTPIAGHPMGLEVDVDVYIA